MRYQGEPVALVAADHPEIARRAAARIVVTYEQLRGRHRRRVGRPRPARRRSCTTGGNVVRHLKIRKGEADPVAPVVVSLDFEVGMQDQAFLGPGVRAGGARRGRRRRPVRRHPVAARGPAPDLPALDLPPEKVRLTLAGVGGAFGGREDLSMHVHACLLALHTGKPVKMVYNREESFFGHVHRHPATMHYEFGAEEDGTLVYGRAEIVLRRRRLRLHAPRRSWATAARSGSGRTACPTCTSTATASTPTTRRAARCAGSAASRPPSRTRR